MHGRTYTVSQITSMRLCAWNSLSGIYCMRGQVIHFKCRKPIFLRATFLMDFWKVGEESRSFFDVVELWWGDGAGDWEPDESRCWRKTHLSVYDYCGQPWFLWLCLYIYIFSTWPYYFVHKMEKLSFDSRETWRWLFNPVEGMRSACSSYSSM